jgi:protein-S-isoprenylcysteine O-methyltransferase Ste14
MRFAMRWGFVVILAAAFFISAVYRARARKATGTIARRQEGTWAVALRAGLAFPLFASVLIYAVNPDWMSWSSVPLPGWIRWAGLAVGVACVPFLWWVFASIGANISETILTKQDHQLVSRGPYRWIRHPLYAGALLAFFCLGLIASNALMLALVVIGTVSFLTVVIPREEERLVAKFGTDYTSYRNSTGRLLPKIFR